MNLHQYYRPKTVDEALSLLASDADGLMPLAGGTLLIGQLETRQRTGVDGVVDLGGLGLNAIDVGHDAVTIGAMATLTDIVEHEVAGALAGGILRRAARGEGPINLRNVATVGGVIAAAEGDSEFYAALLVLNAAVTVQDGVGVFTVPLAEYGGTDGLITGVTVPRINTTSGLARVARTPSDRPIVTAVAVVDGADEHVALCGVAERPILLGQVLNPPDDFKGSAGYRKAMASVVVERALREARG